MPTNKVTLPGQTTTRKETYYIDLIIRPDGQIESEVAGVCGPDCEPLTAWLDDLGNVIEHHSTPDANRKPEQVTTGPLIIKK
jgi:hypothetical protein